MLDKQPDQWSAKQHRRSIMVICGTRPEAIKLAPLITRLRATPEFNVSLCSTGQHREMLHQVFELFQLTPDFDLDLMQDSQTLADVTTSILSALDKLFKQHKPDLVIVHGDTNTTMSASLAAFYNGIKIAHVEAGLRTGNIQSPWPEEANRKITSVLADRNYAPTELSRDNLLSEGIDAKKIIITGNTVIDALNTTIEKLTNDAALQGKIAARLPLIDTEKHLVLVTGHRRENLGDGIESLCRALEVLANRDDVQIIWPVHLNPKVGEAVRPILENKASVHLIPPVQYLEFVFLMEKAKLIITDSGGIQEEAPSLGIPVLVTRDTTERPEAVSSGTVKLVGSSYQTILSEATALLDDPALHRSMSVAQNPYGDGLACKRIVDDLLINLTAA